MSIFMMSRVTPRSSKMANSQNKFTNDGSFLEQFKKLQEQKQAEKRKDGDSHSVHPTVKHLKPVVGRMGGQKRKLPLKQSAKPVHKAFQDESDSDEDERNTNKKRPEAGGPSKLQSEDDFAKTISEAVARSKQAAQLSTISGPASQPQPPVGGVVGRKRRSRWEGGGEENKAISEAIASFTGSSAALTPEQQRQLKDQQEMEVLAAAIRAAAAQSKGRKQKKKENYEYDSDEDVEGGTWEHKKRAKEMRGTEDKAEKLTFEGKGKHFIGDFLPPDELEKFQEKVRALREGRNPDFSDYSQFKLTEENIGFQMLQQAGWSEGSGLGSKGEGIQAPINKGKQSFQQEGVGMEEVGEVIKEDDEFEVYRKRMMLAYRFRPNPLNNPRRPYY